jgi:PPOX class probable F420-dependent enzyme
MPIEIQDAFKQFIEVHRVARLATVDGAGHPSVIPVCYVYEENAFYSAIDAKPKRVASRQLQRIRNIQGNPRVALLIDDYSEKWNELAYMHVRGTANIVEPAESLASEHRRAVAALRLKYTQYRSMTLEQSPLIRIVPDRIHVWSADGHLSSAPQH